MDVVTPLLVVIDRVAVTPDGKLQYTSKVPDANAVNEVPVGEAEPDAGTDTDCHGYII